MNMPPCVVHRLKSRTRQLPECPNWPVLLEPVHRETPAAVSLRLVPFLDSVAIVSTTIIPNPWAQTLHDDWFAIYQFVFERPPSKTLCKETWLLLNENHLQTFYIVPIVHRDDIQPNIPCVPTWQLPFRLQKWLLLGLFPAFVYCRWIQCNATFPSAKIPWLPRKPNLHLFLY